MRLIMNGLPSLLLVLTSMLAAASAADECTASRRPGATLLFPYFETDLADPEGRKTLISIENTSSEAVLTNVVVWTNCGIPVLSFNLALGADAIRPIDLRGLVAEGEIPASDFAPFPGCEPQGNLEEAPLLSLRARLTGQLDDGLCYSIAREPATLAVGSVTVDVVGACSNSILTPHDPGYFTTLHDGIGIAKSDNVLWGDLFLVDDQGNLAQGFEAVTLVADASITGGDPHRSFYERPGDDRRPLGSRYRTRFLQGGLFDGGTQLLAWVAPQGIGPFHCGNLACASGFSAYTALVRARRESGEEVFLETMDLVTTVSRFAVGGEQLPIDAPFGTLDFQLVFHSCRSRKCTPPSSGPLQGWLLPIHTAEGRFSVGLNAAALDDPCSE